LHRPIRTALAAAAALSVAALAGCAPQSQEDQARSVFNDYVAKATSGGGDMNWCDASNEEWPTQPFSFTSEELDVTVGGAYGNQPDKTWVSRPVESADGTQEAEISIVVKRSEGEAPCIETVFLPKFTR